MEVKQLDMFTKQCGSCEEVFHVYDGEVCPNCLSGNWVFGYIDEPVHKSRMEGLDEHE